MRINEETIEIYKKMWLKYDTKASGLISVNDLKDLLLDLILDEVQQIEQIKATDTDEINLMFNTRLQGSLVLYAKLERDVEMNAATKAKIQGSFKIQN